MQLGRPGETDWAAMASSPETNKKLNYLAIYLDFTPTVLAQIRVISKWIQNYGTQHYKNNAWQHECNNFGKTLLLK
jgi:hypothetical protein